MWRIGAESLHANRSVNGDTDNPEENFHGLFSISAVHSTAHSSDGNTVVMETKVNSLGR